MAVVYSCFLFFSVYSINNEIVILALLIYCLHLWLNSPKRFFFQFIILMFTTTFVNCFYFIHTFIWLLNEVVHFITTEVTDSSRLFIFINNLFIFLIVFFIITVRVVNILYYIRRFCKSKTTLLLNYIIFKLRGNIFWHSMLNFQTNWGYFRVIG